MSNSKTNKKDFDFTPIIDYRYKVIRDENYGWGIYDSSKKQMVANAVSRKLARHIAKTFNIETTVIGKIV
jgi:hypothetical protein